MYNESCVILGGNGFIGKRLANWLVSQGIKVAVFDRVIDQECFSSDIITIQGDINCDQNLEKVAKYGKNIIHLISTISPASSIDKVIRAYNCEVSQTIKLLEIIKGTDSRIIFASSGGTVYGEQERYPIKEYYGCNPKNHYAIVKLTIENTLKMYNKTYNMNNLILRIANPYGPGQDYTKGVGVIDAFLKSAIQNKEIQIFGDGKVSRDYIYIDDLCRAFVRAINYNKSHIDTINIGSGKEYSLNDVIQMIRELCDCPHMKIRYMDKRNVDIDRSVLDIGLAKEELGFVPKVELSEGIKLYYKYLIDQEKKLTRE